jgi:hypothetical protein
MLDKSHVPDRKMSQLRNADCSLRRRNLSKLSAEPVQAVSGTCPSCQRNLSKLSAEPVHAVSGTCPRCQRNLSTRQGTPVAGQDSPTPRPLESLLPEKLAALPPVRRQDLSKPKAIPAWAGPVIGPIVGGLIGLVSVARNPEALDVNPLVGATVGALIGLIAGIFVLLLDRSKT